jgi:prevent-host-death family protein
MKTMAAGKFKAQCLAVMDEVQAKREPVVVTKNGKGVVKLVPLDLEDDPLAVFRYPGLEIVGDIMSPLYTDEELDEFFERSASQLAGEQPK